MAEAPVAAPQPSVLARIGNAAGRMYEAVTSHPKELLATGLAIYACAQTAELSLEAAPVMANTGNTPGATATASSLQQECKKSLLAPPTVINQPGQRRTEMINPGGQHQLVVVSLETPTADPNCGAYKGTGVATVEMHSHDNPNQVIDLGNFPYSVSNGDETGGVLSQSASDKADNFVCASKEKNNPRHINRVWIQFSSKVRNAAGHIIGHKERQKNIEIEGHGYGC